MKETQASEVVEAAAVPDAGEAARRAATRERLRSAGQWALVIAVILGVRAWTQRGIASGPAPALAGRDLEGQPVTLASFQGKPVLVHFWATWCSVCMTEVGTIDALAKDHPMITVATDSGQAAEIRAGMAQRGLTFPVVVDADGALARAWGVHAFPTSFFVGPDQTIRYAETGFTSSPGFRARLWLAGR
jgi:thiol-disulfide isomerase/thioredoxin